MSETETKTQLSSELAMSSVLEAVKVYETAKGEYSNACESAFKKYLEALFDEQPKLDVIEFIASTPSFNDGDPCYRSSEIMIEEGDWEEWGHDTESLYEELGIKFNEEKEEYTRKINDLPSDVLATISKNLWKFDDWMEESYETDYKVTITRRNDTEAVQLPDNWDTMSAEEREASSVKEISAVKIEHENYHCGY